MEDKDKINRASTSSSKSSEGLKHSRQKLKDAIAEKRKHKMHNTSSSQQQTLMDPFEAVNKCRTTDTKMTGYIEQESPEHACIWDPLYPENSERVACPKKRLKSLNLINKCVIIKRQSYPDDIYMKIHTQEHMDMLHSVKELPDDKLEEFSAKYDSCYFNQKTVDSAIAAAESAITITLEVAKGILKNGLALIRPPGHHAMTNEFCGYCYINNVALAAQVAIDEGLAKKILIIDHDIHHGQGTQQMFYDRDDVLYFSIHRYEFGKFWPNLRESECDNVGTDKGRGYNINIPLNVIGLTDTEYLAIVLNVLLPVAYEFNPDLIILSAGFDCALGCPEGQMMVTPHFFSHLISLLSGLAQGKIVVCLEGGYFPESLAEGVACTLKALLGEICYPMTLKPEVHPSVIESINNAKFFLRNYWACLKVDPLFAYPKGPSLRDCLEINPDHEHLTVISYQFNPQAVTTYETRDFYPQHCEEEIEKYTKMIMDLRTSYSKGRRYNQYIGYAYDAFLLEHKSLHDELGKCPERPERLTEILKTMEAFGLMSRVKHVKHSETNQEKWIKLIHDSAYLKNIFENKHHEDKADWFFNPKTADCILRCTSCVLSLVDAIHYGHIRSGIAIVRPPGHHACYDKASGFCYVNNVVVAAEYLIKAKFYKRILIVDFDIHHGNGTQNLTYKRDDIFYISIHRFENSRYFPFNEQGDYNYSGEGVGKGYNVNIPFNKGNKTDHDYWIIWLKIVLPLAYSYDPDFVIVSAGFDAGYYDPLGNGYKLTPEIYAHFINTLKPLASGKIMLVLEGGYHLESTSLSATMCVKALLGDPLPMPQLLSNAIQDDTLDTVQKVLGMQKKKWKVLQVNKTIANFSCGDKEKRDLERSQRREVQIDGTVEHLRKLFKKNIKFTEP